jgi:hypothetical protein
MLSFSRFFSKFAPAAVSTPADPKALAKAKMVDVADMLAESGVFGDPKSEFMESEKRSFVGQAMGQVGRTDQIEMTYRGSGVRVLIDMAKDPAGYKVIGMNAVAHPYKNEDMDYAELNRKLTEIRYA